MNVARCRAVGNLVEYFFFLPATLNVAGFLIKLYHGRRYSDVRYTEIKCVRKYDAPLCTWAKILTLERSYIKCSFRVTMIHILF